MYSTPCQEIRQNINDGDLGETRQKIWYERFQLFVGFALFLFKSVYKDEFAVLRSENTFDDFLWYLGLV